MFGDAGVGLLKLGACGPARSLLSRFREFQKASNPLRVNVLSRGELGQTVEAIYGSAIMMARWQRIFGPWPTFGGHSRGLVLRSHPYGEIGER